MRVFSSMSLFSASGLASDQLYNALTWLIPWSQGKMQGISPIQPFFAKIRLENTCECNGLQTNSLGIILREQEINSAFSIRAGNLRESNRAPRCTYFDRVTLDNLMA
jgi:hypothetical protein